MISLLEGSIQSEKSRAPYRSAESRIGGLRRLLRSASFRAWSRNARSLSSVHRARNRSGSNLGRRREIRTFDEFAESRSESRRSPSPTSRWLRNICRLVLVVGATIAVLVVRAITKPLLVLTEGMRRLAAATSRSSCLASAAATKSERSRARLRCSSSSRSGKGAPRSGRRAPPAGARSRGSGAYGRRARALGERTERRHEPTRRGVD